MESFTTILRLISDPLTSNKASIRIMFRSNDPRTPAPYIRYFNDGGQAISSIPEGLEMTLKLITPLEGLCTRLIRRDEIWQ